jgi:hypothetical protein
LGHCQDLVDDKGFAGHELVTEAGWSRFSMLDSCSLCQAICNSSPGGTKHLIADIWPGPGLGIGVPARLSKRL